MNEKTYQELAKKIGYEFRDPKLIELACIHKSYGNEFRASQPIDQRNNERLEFLGDAVLDFVISQMLLEEFPECSEGDLSKMRAGLVNERTLAVVARDLDLGKFVRLGKGEDQTGGREKESILSSLLEAIIAAIYLDGGFTQADAWIRSQFGGRVSRSRETDGLQDYKTRLQEVVQARFKSPPRYSVVESIGPDHDKTFSVELSVNGRVVASASGKSKKEAEQGAAKSAFEQYGPLMDIDAGLRDSGRNDPET